MGIVFMGWSIMFQPRLLVFFYIIIKNIGIKMKAFSEVKSLFLGIFCDVKEIHSFRVLPQVFPQISKSQNFP